MKKTGEYKFLIKLIEQWPVRAKRAGIKNSELAKMAELSHEQFSRIINFKSKNPRISTIDKVETALELKGV